MAGAFTAPASSCHIASGTARTHPPDFADSARRTGGAIHTGGFPARQPGPARQTGRSGQISMNSPNPVTAPLSIDPAEIAHFEALAEQWWDPHGKFGILHKFNPARLGFIREAVGAHFNRDPASLAPFAGLRLL